MGKLILTLMLILLQTSTQSHVSESSPTSASHSVSTQTERCAEQFVEFYYNTFDQDRNKLAALYVRVHPEYNSLPSLLAY